MMHSRDIAGEGLPRATVGISGPVDDPDRSTIPTSGRRVFFYPHQAVGLHYWGELVSRLGWKRVDAPAEADWCMLNHVATKVELRADDPYAAASWGWLNGRCRDISKQTVERVFGAAFGYALAIDPTTYRGQVFRKNDRNAVKDGLLLTCPIPAAEVRKDCVYERFVDSRTPGVGIVEYRTFVVAGQIVAVRRQVIADWTEQPNLAVTFRDRSALPPDAVFTREEQAAIAVGCAEIGLDIGVLDIMRDRGDGRIYVLDVTKTPSIWRWGRQHEREEMDIARAVGRAWERAFPPQVLDGFSVVEPE